MFKLVGGVILLLCKVIVLAMAIVIGGTIAIAFILLQTAKTKKRS